MRKDSVGLESQRGALWVHTQEAGVLVKGSVASVSTISWTREEVLTRDETISNNIMKVEQTTGFSG